MSTQVEEPPIAPSSPPAEPPAKNFPQTRPDLLIRPAGKEGKYVVKSPSTGAYFQVGEEERFLIGQLDGKRTSLEVQAAFEQRFGESLSREDLIGFLEMAGQMGLLVVAGGTGPRRALPLGRRLLGLLYFRKRLFDPDRLFDKMEPWLRPVWSTEFLFFSLLFIAWAGLLAWTNWSNLVTRVGTFFSFETLALFWLTAVLTLFMHEFAHGLTCKHFGGEVREIGVLMMFFTPCFYCNVSDAWLFPERWKRIWVGLSGPFLDVLISSVAMVVWRLTVQDSFINYVSWTVMATCMGRTLLNFNPLMKSDGYYLLSDCLEIPNLSQHGNDYWMATARWLLWGAPRPAAQPKGRTVLAYGVASWLFTLVFLGLMVQTLMQLPGSLMGAFGFALSLLIVGLMAVFAFGGILTKEVRTMIQSRRLRTMGWCAAIAGAASLLFVVPMEDSAGGHFQVRPHRRVEVRASESGFLEDLQCEEGSYISTGSVVGRIHVPDLEVTIAKKQAELREAQANLTMMEAGPRREEVEAQRQKVERHEHWCSVADSNLLQAKEALKQDLIRLERQVAQAEAELSYARTTLAHAEQLHRQKALAGEQLSAERKRCEVAELQLDQAKAQHSARSATGVLEFENEVTRRKNELSDVRAALNLLEAGSRPEAVEAERARVARLTEDVRYYEAMRERLLLKVPVTGVLTTARMKEKSGQYFEKGSLICVVEDTSSLEAEIAIPEEVAATIEPGQRIELKARSLPFRRFVATVSRKAPSSILSQGQLQGTVTVYCKLGELEAELLPGMTGVARVVRGSHPAGYILAMSALRYLRTEFWW